MTSLIFLLLCSVALSLLLTPACRYAAVRVGLVDKPDNRRKLHHRPVPRIGGVPIIVSFAASFVLLILFRVGAGAFVKQNWSAIDPLLPAVFIVFLTGLLDDVRGLAPYQKLAGQVAAAVFACWAGVQIHSIGGFTLGGPWWQMPLTVLWLVGCTNAFNLIDGVDGLAAGVGLFASITTLIVALLQGNMPLALATIPLVGALVGFLPFNFNPASIFLGDCGSLSVGFLLGCYSIIWSSKSATMLGMTAPLLALSIPLLDTALAIVRRFLAGQPIFGADRGHIHHRLLARGLTPRRVALVMYCACGLAAALSLVLSSVRNHLAGLAIVVFCGVVWIAIHYLGYIELQEARLMIFGGLFRRVLNNRISIRQFEQAVSQAETLDQCWAALLDASKKLGLNEAQFRVNGKIYDAAIGQEHGADCWNFRVPLPEEAFTQFAVPFHGPLQGPALAPFANAIRTTLGPKVAEHLRRQHELQ